MPKLFLVPNISIFDVHDVAVREWLYKLDDAALSTHLDYPFKLDRFFPESSRHALRSVDAAHHEVLRLLDIIDPQAVFLDISVDFIELENKYNNRKMSPLEFWSRYYQISAGMSDSLQTIYCIYIKGIIDKNIRLIESKDHLPLTVAFYGTDVKTREALIPVYEEAFDRDSDFVLHIARVINEITNLREAPKHLWYSPMQERQAAISYEEAERFYTELSIRLERMLRFRVREYIVKNLREQALEYITAYEKFLEYKIMEDEIKSSNIIEGLKLLTARQDHRSIVIFCAPMHYSALMSALKKEKCLSELGISIGDIDIETLLDKIMPFTVKNRIMQSNYDIALNMLDVLH